MIEQTIVLRSVIYGITPVIHMVQNDTGRVLKMVLDDITIDEYYSAEIAFQRSDKSYYTDTTEIEVEENAFVANMEQALTRPGVTKCQLKVMGGDELVVSTYRFDVHVQESTDGIPVAQLGYDIYDLIEAAQQIQPTPTSGITEEIKQALLQIASKVAYIDADGQTYYDDLYNALYANYTVTNNLIDVTNSNTATRVTDGDSYTATLEANSGLIISSLTITMGGVDITNSVFTAS